MVSDLLPADGPALIGPVPLPPGSRLRTGVAGEPVAWVTSEPVGDAGLAWQALSDLHPQTGLVPVLICGPDGPGLAGPEGEAGLDAPADVAQLSRMDAAVVLAREWDGPLPPGEDDDEAAFPAAQRAPFGPRFPGLAPAVESSLTAAGLHDVLVAIPASHLALVPAGRPADVLPLIGWAGASNRWGEATPAAAVLRSWETRFGARLLQVGSAAVTVLAGRPPRDQGTAQRIAAEHRAFCDECGGDGLVSISDISARLLATPLWSFRWHRPPAGD
jgi:hypothetical protein